MALILPALSADRVAAQADGLFAAVEPARMRQLPDAAAADVRGVTTIRSRLVAVDAEGLAAARGVVGAAGRVAPGGAPILTLNLFDDVVLSGVVEGTAPTASGTGYVLFGRLDGVNPGTLTLLIYEEGLLGTVRTATAKYDIRPIGDGVHAVRQVDTSMLPPESEPLLPSSLSPDADAEDRPISSADDGSVIDVAVFYTGAARDRAPHLTGITGIGGLVDKMVADTNIAFSRSGATQRIRRVRLQRVNDYNASGEVLSLDALNALRDTDGLMDEVHGVRDRHGADLVALIAALDDHCGRAFRMTDVRSDFEAFAFSVTGYACHWDFAFAHELGHNMGLSHDRYAEKCPSSACNEPIDNLPYPYSFGYVNQAGLNQGVSSSRRWRTIMAYGDQCGSYCDKILYFSTPAQSMEGDPLGVSGILPSQSVTGPSDAVRTLNQTRTTVANFRQSRGMISPDLPDLVVQSPRVSSTTLTPGQSFRMTVVVRNTGLAMSDSNSASLQHYRSADSTINRSDTAVGNAQTTLRLGEGTRVTVPILLTAPNIDGTYYYGACVSATAESNTTNNCSMGVQVTVTVANRSPETVGSLSALTLRVTDGAVTVEVSGAFRDPDRDLLTYGATSSDTSVTSVSVSGSSLRVTPVSGGTTTVTVTATDVDGSNTSATQTFAATVANRAPLPVGRLPALTLRVSEGERSVPVAGAFEDPDRDALSYAASSSDESVATAVATGSTVRVTPLSSGTATVTVTAEDGGGLRAEQAFAVTVANRSPERVGSLPALELQTAAGAVAVEVSGAFQDPDDDVLTYGAASSAVTVAAVSVSTSPSRVMVMVTPLSRGTATVTVTATDAGGSNTAAAQTFGVRVDGGPGPGPGPGGPPGGGRNRAPQAVGTLADRTLEVGESLPMEVAEAFRDRDGDVLTHAAESSAADVAAVSVSGGVVRVAALSAGEAEVTVTATDVEGSNRSATQTFTVTVSWDADGDGLIGVHTPAQLEAVRHDVDGDGEPAAAGAAGYAAAFGATDSETGTGTVSCLAAGGCRGYELGSDLDLDTNGSGGPDAGDAYWHGEAGWLPLGTAAAPFAATFEGNGRVVRGLFVRRSDVAGLFGTTGTSSVVRGVGVTAVDVTGGTAVGGLVGVNGGLVTGSHATGRVSGSEAVGGLVGSSSGVVVGSYAAVEVSGDTAVGGLVGANAGRVAAVHATGRVSGTRRVGGLVGFNRGALAAGYATGRVSGRAESGGLVGVTEVPGTVSASYWDTDTSGRRAGASGDGAALAGRGRPTSALQAPTDYAGLYAAWHVDVDGDGAADAPWDFGTAAQYPALSLDVDGDGVARWQEVGRQLRAGPELTAAAAVDPARVDLTWTAVDAGAGTPSPEVTYTVTREAGDAAETVATGLRGLRYVDLGVEPGSAHTYQVAAVVAGGEAARSALVPADVPCTYMVAPLHRDVLWTADTGEVSVSTGRACAWTASSDSASEAEDFLTVTSGAAGTGSGTVTWAVEANAGVPREGTLLVAGRRVTVYQASPTAWTDDPIRRRVTPVRAIHFMELRARIDALRTGAGLPALGWTDPALIPGLTPIQRVHLTELRQALAAAQVAAGQPAITWTAAAVPGGTVITATHLMELRGAVAALE